MELTTREKQRKRTRKREDLRVIAVEFAPSTPGAENGLGKVYDLLLSPRLHEGKDSDTEG